MVLPFIWSDLQGLSLSPASFRQVSTSVLENRGTQPEAVWVDGWSECWRLCCVLLMLLHSPGSSEARVFLSLPDYLARL